jgi:hypothetical protein
MSTFSYLSFLLIYIFCVYPTNAGTFSVDYNNHYFVKDGKPWQYISGSVHYFRIHPDLWEDRLAKVRALGLNAIQVYTAWTLHEPTPGKYVIYTPVGGGLPKTTLSSSQKLEGTPLSLIRQRGFSLAENHRRPFVGSIPSWWAILSSESPPPHSYPCWSTYLKVKSMLFI